jgi:two-component system chemotaxis sensor kinase CheA
VTAQQGAEGLEALQRQRFDLVISDLEMPVLDGWSLAAAVRRIPGCEHLPLLALTTLSSDEDRQRAIACGFDAFQVKLERDTFLACVARLLQGAQRAPREGEPADV